MPTIEAQLELEQKMIDRGAETYLKNQRKAEEQGRAADLDYSRRLMQEFMQPLIEALTEELEKKGPSKNGRGKTLLRRVDPAKAMFIAMRGMFNSFSNEEQVVLTCTKIGKLVEDEIRFARFQEHFGDYYATIIKDFKRKGTKDYRYMQRVLTHSANENEDEWVAWSQSERADVGSRLLDIILRCTDLCTKSTYYVNGKTKIALTPTDSAKEWINEHETIQQFLYPDRTPCVIEPDQWSGMYQGGYYSPRMRSSTPMIKASSTRHKKLLERADLSRVQDALNIVQSTPWQVNQDILTVVKTVWAMDLSIGMPSSTKLAPAPSPFKDFKESELTEDQKIKFKEWKHEAAEIYTQEKDRVSKSFQITRIIRIANDYCGYDKFWYVWYADFRGRLYTATAGFSPQGPDLAKGLLRFGEGKPLGDTGFYWLKVHLANRFGYDKVSYDARVAWVDERKEEFCRAATDPLSYRETWANADKPWQFLAGLMEYNKVCEGEMFGIPASTFVSYLPIGLDGSCNGLQNFSAMLRDPVGGAATNLIPADVPADIYSRVAEVCTEKLRKRIDPEAQQWCQWADKYGKGKLPRGLAKRPVMTLPYGATRQSCTKYIFQHILENDKNFFQGNFKAACYLTPILWESIGEVVVAAREAMDWLQKCAGVMSKVNKPITWQVADGFIATQHARELTTHQIDTQLQGRFQLRIGTYNDNINRYKQRSGIAPNFIHSQDALHLRTTVRLARNRGIVDLACIHDDYGTHACNTELLHRCIRDAFVVLYQKGDPLTAFKAQQEATGTKLPDVPLKGDLNIEQVRDSSYFFG